MAQRNEDPREIEKRRASSNVRLAIMLGLIVVLLYVTFLLLNA